MKKNILITGASTGFGLQLASKLFKLGFNVIGTSREPEKYKDKVPFRLLRLDISDDDSINTFTKELFTQIEKLDVLVNNAGFFVTGLAEETPTKIGLQQFETNFWGTIKLTNALLPNMRNLKQGKIITVGSFLGLIGHPNLSYYSASKHALEGYFKSLRFELTQFNIKISMIEPTFHKTNFVNNAVATHGNIKDYDTFRQKIHSYYNNELKNAPEPTIVANTIINVINSKNPKFSYPVGKGTAMILALQRFAYNAFESVVLKGINKAK
ncbi:SDR family NAD(P)-dependent oxidoreductase [Flavobacterium sufflavum]|uniref:SDR family NAD(P)-dependent oxidoreductase n=1 Tax=Flavobacterium sufflavum TaxID=1921138 RepID=A0A437KSZ9_9FLAO|nr:SDR family NAD(P)-dependent oxidoreductase [Flavobacterium sufflavum]RVT75266.1 SDR family NAD(P)-dependent oxidoreductase [Flavobacterium sufflavum]